MVTVFTARAYSPVSLVEADTQAYSILQDYIASLPPDSDPVSTTFSAHQVPISTHPDDTRLGYVVFYVLTHK